MSNYLTTMNHDLQGLTKLILGKRFSPNFNSVPVFSLLRDICITLYEANKVLKEDGIIHTDLPNINVIREIRHKVKTNQGIKNRETFIKLLNGHKSIFGHDIDNLGFYLDDTTLAGSTLFGTFIFADTPLFNMMNKNVILDFSITIGSLIQEILYKINQPIGLESKPLKIFNEKEYILKDIWDKRFFKSDITYNVFLTRLLLIQNEIITCVWLKNHLDCTSLNLTLDKYILLRLTSIKLFETMRNLLDIQKLLPQHWNAINLTVLDPILNRYKSTHIDEIKTLRNMLHYSNHRTNFYDYIHIQTNRDPIYPDKLIETIFNDYIYKIRNVISTSLNIRSYESMNDFEKIVRRIKSRYYPNTIQ
ncbi:hypothetical protein QCI42_22525 [Bacillus fungorum]|uniref:hypothetical protein n=1 Tax=Bacillus fungorum TaxID=2039284 RepID=UPI003397C311